jgi:site-specific DNA-cytosine methylase
MEHSEAPFKFIDLFAGIGGLRRGFDAIGGECVFTCEMNKYSQETYRANFGATTKSPVTSRRLPHRTFLNMICF